MCPILFSLKNRSTSLTILKSFGNSENYSQTTGRLQLAYCGFQMNSSSKETIIRHCPFIWYLLRWFLGGLELLDSLPLSLCLSLFLDIIFLSFISLSYPNRKWISAFLFEIEKEKNPFRQVHHPEVLIYCIVFSLPVRCLAHYFLLTVISGNYTVAMINKNLKYFARCEL